MKPSKISIRRTGTTFCWTGRKNRRRWKILKTIIRNVGRAGIPVFGYNFSIAGVAGRMKGKFARGDAEAVGMDGPLDKPLPNGMVWNMVYDKNAAPGEVPSATAGTTLVAPEIFSG